MLLLMMPGDRQLPKTAILRVVCEKKARKRRATVSKTSIPRANQLDVTLWQQ
ncbi:hypothetical protein JMG10_46865 [Nostoc ellipsosporum NOK]|nr:hypothetical protein [Nostoc ellipsosporum NOK]